MKILLLVIFEYLLLNSFHCQTMNARSADEVCLALRRDGPAVGGKVQQGRPGKIGPRGFLGPKGDVGAPGRCTCDPQDLHKLQTSIRNVESK